MAGFAQIYSTAIEQPKDVILPAEPLPIVDEVKDDIATHHEAPVGGDLEFQEQEMPEGITVTKWEEWAYVSSAWTLRSQPVPLLQW